MRHDERPAAVSLHACSERWGSKIQFASQWMHICYNFELTRPHEETDNELLTQLSPGTIAPAAGRSCVYTVAQEGY
jgi:hypothetical protein